MITFGVCSWVLDREGIAAIQRASELGFEAIDLGFFSMEDYEEIRKPETQSAYVEAATKYNIKLACMTVGIFSHFIALHDKEQEATVREIFSNIIDVVAAMKIELLACAVFDGIGDFAIHNAEEMAQASTILRRACEYIGDRPIQIATESHMSIKENRDLLNQVNHPKMRIMVDSGAGLYGSGYNPAEMVREMRDSLYKIAHVQDGPDDALIGKGDGDFAATAQALKDIGFEGYVISENNYKNDAETRAATDLATLKGEFYQ